MAVSVHKWLLNKFRDINHSRMDKHIDIIAKNSGKSKAYIKFDIIRNFLIRGTGYTDYFRCDFINLSAKEKKTFVTAKTFYKILEYLNDEEYIVLLRDKLVFDELFKKYLKRDFIKNKIQGFLHLGHEFCAAGVIFVLVHHLAQF